MPIHLTVPPYRNSSNQWYTATLFWERWVMIEDSDKATDPVFSLDEDIPGLINARRTYIDFMDPTGYTWAIKYLGSWQHWNKLIKAPWFRDSVNLWNDEIKVILKQQALQKIKEIASEASPQAYQAAKYLASAEWEKPPHGRGRPSKSELQGELLKAARVLSQEEDDAQRIGLTVIKGGKP